MVGTDESNVVASSVGGVVVRGAWNTLKRRITKAKPVKAGFWGFEITNTVLDIQFYGVFRVGYTKGKLELSGGVTWLAGGAPISTSKWGQWKTSLAAYDNEVLFAYFRFEMHFVGKNKHRDFDSILKLDRHSDITLSGFYNSCKTEVGRYGTMNAQWLADTVEAATKKSWEVYGNKRVSEPTLKLLQDAKEVAGVY